jgi:threonine dehydrogenase-like Zn-dependent dehydrogenase
MCRNGRYTERGIKERDGYGSELFRVEPEFLIKLDPSLGLNGVLVEPTSIVAKAWDHTERIGRRSRIWAPKTLLVTGAGPIGLLAAMMGVLHGLEVHVLDHNDRGPKRQIVRELGASFHVGELADVAMIKPDILMECTGAPAVVRDALGRTAATGIVCLLGVSAPGRDLEIDVGGLNRTMVLDNDAVFGAVNANRQHYLDAVMALQRADQRWLDSLITRRVPVEQWKDALVHQRSDIKVVVDFS